MLLSILRLFGLPAAVSAAIFVFVYLGRDTAPALAADLKPKATVRKAWQHFALHAAYVLFRLFVAAIVCMAIKWAIESLAHPSPDTTRQEARTIFVNASRGPTYCMFAQQTPAAPRLSGAYAGEVA